MSWLFSRALVEEYSAATCSDGVPSVPLNVMPTLHKFWRNDKTMDASRLSRFGLTCAILTEDHGTALLTSYLEGFRARTSAPQGGARALTASAQASGVKWHELSVRYDPATSSWRTHLSLWDEALPWSSVTLPRWGMTRSGLVFQHPTAERPINETVSGLWRKPGSSKNAGWGLSSAVKMWPTPLARDGKSGVLSEAGRAKRERRRGQPLNEIVGGLLNPTWVEWLMGWPQGWTDLRPLAMDKFREWQQQHGMCLPVDEEAA